MLRPIGVRHYLDVMRNKGIPAEAVLQGSGLNEVCLSNPNLLIDPIQCRAVISNLITLKGDQGIGFDVGLSTTLSTLGAVGHATMTCKSMRDTHRIWGRFGSALVGIMGRLDIVNEDSDNVTFEFSNQDPLDPLQAFHVEEFLSILKSSGQPLVKEAPLLKKLTFSYSAPLYKNRYYELFDCPIDFGSAQTSVTIDREWFEKRLQTNDDEFNRICLQHCEDVLLRIEHCQPVSALVRSLFITVGRVLPKQDEAAKTLNMSERTLSRRLQQEGTNFRKLTDEFRANKARECVRLGNMSQKEIAFLLGFNEPSAFHHAFKAWTGRTVREYREKVQEESDAFLKHH